MHSPTVEGVPVEKVVIAGLLHKWVNYGHGWKHRWFVLEQGMLSYYKRDGISVVQDLQRRKSVKLIGEEAQRLLKKEKAQGGAPESRLGKNPPLGEAHLQVSTMRESRGEDTKFYIFSGTKTLHLRAESKEARVHWMEALQAYKESFTTVPAVVESPSEGLAFSPVSTQRLRGHLAALGVPEAGILQAEDIVRQDIMGPLQRDLQEEHKKKVHYIALLRGAEADRVELETAVVSGAREHNITKRQPSMQGGRPQSDNPSENEDEDEADGGSGVLDEGQDTESDTDDATYLDDDVFFETAEDFGKHKMSGTKGRSARMEGGGAAAGNNAAAGHGAAAVVPSSPLAGSPPTSGRWPKVPEQRLVAGGAKGTLAGLPDEREMESVGFAYPSVPRREKLPAPAEEEKAVSLWSIIKDNVGKDLSRVCLPVYFNEPISTLQKCFEEIEYSWLLDRAYEYGRRGNHLMRALHIAAFAVSGYSCTLGRMNKPFNPLLGETYEAEWEDKGVKFVAEKVSHHPTIVACHCDGRGWRFWGDSNLKSKFWGPSIQLDPVGVLTLEFEDGERFEWRKVTTSINNIIIGKLYVDHYGMMKIDGNRGLSINLKFKERSLMDRNPHQVRGYVENSDGDKLATLAGKWDTYMAFVPGDLSRKDQREGSDALESATLIWQRAPPTKYPMRYNLTSFAIKLNEITPGLEKFLPPTDSRLRPDQKALENGQFEFSNTEKLRLEQRQRRARKDQEGGWSPKWFQQMGPHSTWTYTGGYWEARSKHDWTMCPNIFSTEDVNDDEAE